MSKNQGKDKPRRGRTTIAKKEPTGYPTIGVRQLGAGGFRLLLGGPECGLGGLKAFPESL
jgi:hypothetical protein